MYPDRESLVFDETSFLGHQRLLCYSMFAAGVFAAHSKPKPRILRDSFLLTRLVYPCPLPQASHLQEALPGTRISSFGGM